MTALIILENHELTKTVTFPRTAAGTEGTSMHLVAGEQLSVENLLRGLLIRSGNDAAITLALFHSGSEAEFVQVMNQRAAWLGMTSTHFMNSHGLDATGHESTAADLAILARKALEFPEIRTMANTRKITVNSLDGRFSHELVSTNDLLGSPFPVSGLKTGTTDAAGECLITLFRLSADREILLIVLGSTNRFQDVKTLFSPFLDLADRG